ncbi:metallophosphoesterase [Candidatus Woesearchaeota archaeon]|nr:metallophosphoesterase [Candidatus Woesearchaeota archaeon]
MKILAFTDTHGSMMLLKKIERKARYYNADLLVCAGDISIFERGIFSILKRLNKIGKKIIIVHGNHEDAHTLSKYSKSFKNLIFIHKKPYAENNLLFLGYGGGGFSIRDREFEKIIQQRFSKIINDNKDKKIILITHAPPYGTRLDRIGKNYCGNKSIRKFIERNKVDLHICGHLHENFGKEDKIGKTKLINPGPFGKMILI